MKQFNISYTFISTYKRCHRRALLQYVEQVVPREKVDHRNFIVGICADQLFNKWVKEGYREDWMENEAESWFKWFAGKRLVRYRNIEDRDKLIRKLKISVNRLQEAVFCENLPQRNVEMQKKLEYLGEDFKFVGRLDMWFPDEKAVWDLKITEAKRYLDNFQLYFFAWLFKQMGVEVKSLAFLSPLMQPYLKLVDWSLSALADFEQELFYLLELIKAEDWRITAKDCWSCPVQSWCEEPPDSYKKVEKTKAGGIRFDL